MRSVHLDAPRVSAACLAVALSIGALPPPAAAEDRVAQQAAGTSSDQPAPADFWRQVDDLGGLRSWLADGGVGLVFSYYGDALGNPTGGVEQGAAYVGRLGTIIDADLGKLLGWTGAAFHASVHQIHGQGLSGSHLQNLATVSGIEAPATTRLFNLWIEQRLGGRASLRLGQVTAAQEFLVSDTANLFVNATFGWPAIVALDLPSGGPAYPEATPGARLKLSPNEHLTVLAAVFDGDPAGPGPGGPARQDPSGLAFRLNDPPLLIAEIGYAYNRASGGSDSRQEGTAQPASRSSEGRRPGWSGLPGTIKLGAWRHMGRFADQRIDQQGLSLADPSSSGRPLMHHGDFGVYALLDQTLWRPSGAEDRGLSGFLRVSASPGDRNLIDRYADAGIVYTGLVPGRPKDAAGIGLAVARISPRAAALDRDTIAATGVAIPVRDYEAVVELTYQARLAGQWWLQPVFQYILHPGGNVQNPRAASGATPIPDAAVLGLRTIVKF